MKTPIRISLFFVLCFSYTANGQTTWIPNATTWFFGMQDPFVTGYISYSHIGDSLIQAQVCKAVQVRDSFYVFPTQQYGGAIRDTTYSYASGDTVFLWNKADQQFYPMMVFGLNPGDTIQTKLYQDYNCYGNQLVNLVIDSVGTTLVGGLLNLRYAYCHIDQGDTLPLLYPTSLKFTERLGYAENWGPNAYCVTDIPYSPLRCYSDDLLDIQNASDCSTILSTGSWNFSQPLKIFPNPAVNSLHITGLEIPQFAYRIFDCTGALRQQGYSGSETLNIQGLKPGVYILETEQESLRRHTRFVKY